MDEYKINDHAVMKKQHPLRIKRMEDRPCRRRHQDQMHTMRKAHYAATQ